MRYVLLGLLVSCCSTPKPKPVTTHDGYRGYELNYYVDINDTYKEISRTCPEGYEVKDWEGPRPKVIVCQSQVLDE